MKFFKLKLTFFALLIFAGSAFSQLDISNNKYPEAIKKLNICISVMPNDYEAYFFRGICKYYLNDNLGAEQDLNIAIKNYCPEIYDAYHYRALVKNRLEDYEGAVMDFNKIIDKQSTKPQLYMERAFSKLYSQDYNGALSDCNKVFDMQVFSEDLYLCKAVAESALREFDNALLDYDKALTINPINVEIFGRRGMTKALMGNHQEAIDDYNRALKIDSGYTFAYYNRAIERMELKDYKGAMQDYNIVLKYEPMNALVYFNRAVLEADMKEYRNAVTDFDKVLALNPENIQALLNRANLKQTINDYKGALTDYNKIIELFPYYIEAYYDRASLKKNSGDFAGAKKDSELGKIMSEMNRSRNSSQIAHDSLALTHLTALDADFSNDDLKSADTINIELMPLFNIALKDSSIKNSMYHDLLLLKTGKREYDAFCLTNKELPIKNTLADSSLGVQNREVKNNNTPNDLRLRKAIQKTTMQLFNDAVKDYDKIIEQDPNCAIAYFARGVSTCREIELINSFGDGQYFLSNKKNTMVKSQKNEKYEKALSDFNKAIQLEPTFAFAYYNRAYVKYELMDLNGAVKDYNNVIQTNPDLADAYFNRGLLLVCLKDRMDACEDFSKAGELGLTQSYKIIKKYCHHILK